MWRPHSRRHEPTAERLDGSADKSRTHGRQPSATRRGHPCGLQPRAVVSPAMKELLRKGAQALGVDLARRSSVHFGIRWEEDLGAFATPATALDIGANVGQTAILLKARFPAITVWSFEPVPSTFEKLTSRVKDLSGVTPVQSAMGANAGSARITDTPIHAKNTLLVDHKPDGTRTVKVAVDTVDDFMKRSGLDHLDLLKIDTEGYEMEVLAGARTALTEGRISFVFAECTFYERAGEPHGDFRALDALLTPLGYRVVSFYTGGVDSDGWSWGNVLFMLPPAARPVRTSPFGRTA
jgi:FkbM family methyltransferase